MNNKTLAFITEAVSLLKNTKTNCPPSLEREIDGFIDQPNCLDKAKELLQQAQANAGMFNKGYIAGFIAKVDGGFYSEKEFFAERLPGEQ